MQHLSRAAEEIYKNLKLNKNKIFLYANPSVRLSMLKTDPDLNDFR